MRVMSAGNGYRYLLDSVAVADGQRDPNISLTAYYAQTGTPPGRWLGSGLVHLGEGAGWIASGDVVTEEQLASLVGQGRDPVTGDPLGLVYPDYPSRRQRIDTRCAKLDPKLTAAQRSAAVESIKAEEAANSTRRAVAGFDFTFSVPKSVSVWWALAGPSVQTQIVAAHHAAVTDVVGVMERQVAATRTGVNTTDGAVAQVAVEGLIATAFDHYDSRAGDPQLHTHVVISNKVKTVLDGKWRSLDGRPMHAAVVALSEHYNTLLADHLTRTLGIAWKARERGRDRNPAWEIAGIPEELIEAFSTRSHAIDVETDRLIATYLEEHGHRPSATTIIKLRQQATLSTRTDKTVRSLADLTAEWQQRASHLLGDDPLAGLAPTTGRREDLVRAETVPVEVIGRIGARVVEVVGERRSTWRRWNLRAEASRQTMGLRFASTEDRELLLEQIVDAAEHGSLRLTPPELASSPVEFRRADGTSVFRPQHSAVFTSTELLAAEDRLLNLARTTTAPTLPAGTVARTAGRDGTEGRVLSADQTGALVAVAGSGRIVDVLVGPAGAGKTTAMRALRHAWESLYGTGSVVGLAPSAAAAHVLADDLGIETDNTAKWLHDHHAGRARFTAGQLVIIDEASLAGTRTLDQITSHAATSGAKVLLVGDWAQLAAVEAGGAFGMLVRDRTDPPELTDVRRFHHDWEKPASLQLRNGEPSVITTYQQHGRIQDGDTDTMLDRTYQAWLADIDSGRSSVMIAATSATVSQLNAAARHDRIGAGQVDPTGQVRLHDGTDASTGDLIVTRNNNRRLTAGNGWVKNGDRWVITTINDDGSASIRRAGRDFGATGRLSGEYLAEHVELGYAITAHRAQGSTVDTAHTVVQPGMTRETLYVAMTRGRQANIAYVSTDQPDTEAHQQHDSPTARSVLAGVLSHSGAERSAHERIDEEQDRWTLIAQLAAEYETLAATAQHERWTTLIRIAGLTSDQTRDVVASDAWGPLCAALRRADAFHVPPERILPQIVADWPIDGADDVTAVIHHRLDQVTGRLHAHRFRNARLIVGLIPQATGPMPERMRQSLTDRQQLIEQRAHNLATHAVAQRIPWVRSLGPCPGDPVQHAEWISQVSIVAAYRDRYAINDADPFSEWPTSPRQRLDATAARTAQGRARKIARPDDPIRFGPVRRPSVRDVHRL